MVCGLMAAGGQVMIDWDALRYVEGRRTRLEALEIWRMPDWQWCNRVEADPSLLTDVPAHLQLDIRSATVEELVAQDPDAPLLSATARGGSGMQVYFAGAVSRVDVAALREAGITNVVISWRNVSTRGFDRLAACLEGMNVLLDPGYGTGGRPEEYLAFARAYEDLWAGCLAWDVPGGDVLENVHWFLWCGSAGLPSMVPVFHPGMPWRFLGAMQQLCGRVAIGGLLQFPLRQRIAYLDELFYRPDGSLRAPGLRAHGCGMDHPDILARYPWDSVDSMTWLNPRRFGKGGTLQEAICRQADKARIQYRPVVRQRWLFDPAHELAYGASTIGWSSFPQRAAAQ